MIDHLCDRPHDLIAAAQDAAFIDVGPTYPGVRAPAPPGYGDAVLEAFASQLKDVFGGQAPWGFDLCAFSMVTTPPADLNRLQRLPHFDGVEPNRLAFLHYLCDAGHGGTAFYRQRSSGYERIHPQRLEPYLAHLHRDTAQAQAVPPAYTTGDSPLFARIGGVEAVFNRAVFYPGSLLHSGEILAPDRLSEDVHSGRLTLNGFVVLDPA